MIFHNKSNYDYQFIIKELAKEVEGDFSCLGENTKKYKKTSVAIKKKVARTSKDGEEILKTISCKIKFIGSARLMASSLSNFIDWFTEGIHKIKNAG